MGLQIADDYGQTGQTPDADPETLTAAELEEREYNRQVRHNQQVAIRVDQLRVDQDARARLRAEAVATSNFEDQFLTRAALEQLPKPEPLIDRVIPRHAYGILRGRDHSFKSFVAVDWACCLATGKPWQQHPAEQVRVLYIAGEGAHGLAKRINAWEYAWGKPIDDHMLTIRKTALNLHQPGPAFDHLLEHVTHGNYGLVIIDTLRRVSGGADGNSSEMGAVIDNIDRIKNATNNGTVLAVAHTDKGDHDTRGYSGIEDDADFVWSAKRDETLLTLKLAKMKDGPDGRELTLEANSTQAGSLVLYGTDGQPITTGTESQSKVLEALRQTSIDGVTSTVLMEASSMSSSSFYRALKQLHEAGQIVNIGTPTRKLWALPAIDTEIHESQPLPYEEPPPDLGFSHYSQ